MSYILIADDFMLDIDLFTLSSIDGGQVTRLSKMEVEVLKVLCVHAGKTVTRQFLFEEAWVNNTGNNGHLNRVILLLRRKFESLGAHEIIKTIPRVGYSIERATYFESADLLPFSIEGKSHDKKLEHTGEVLELISRNKKSNEHIHDINNGVHAKKKLIKLAVVVVISMVIMLSSQFNIIDMEKLQLGIIEMNHYNKNNVSVFYADEINKSDFKKMRLLKQ